MLVEIWHESQNLTKQTKQNKKRKKQNKTTMTKNNPLRGHELTGIQ